MGLVEKQIKIEDFLVPEVLFNTLEFNAQEINYLKEHKTIKMCIIPNLMPYSEIKNGSVTGFVDDYIKLIEEQLPVKFELVTTYSMAQTLEYLKTKKCEVLPTAQISESRKEFLNFSKEYINIPFVLVTQNSEPFFRDISTLKDKKIVLIKGYALSELLKKTYLNFDFIEVED
jgi:ABC-type amino acid transport substrate-binding protein